MKNYYILIASALLASCSNLGTKNKAPIDNDTYVTTVSKSKQVHMLNMYSDLTNEDRGNLKRLATKLVNNNVKKVVLIPVVPNVNKANMYKHMLNEIKNIFMKAGVSISEIYINLPEIDEQKSGIRIESYTYKANLPTAKKWKYPIGDVDITKELPNLGVSAEYNLGSMIANPKDLVDPAPLDNMDATSAIAAIKNGNSGSNSSSSGSSDSSSVTTSSTGA